MTSGDDVVKFARSIRLSVAELCHAHKASHIGGSYSVADILAVFYGAGVLNIDPAQPNAIDRDRLFYSKGHASAALYAALELRGFFPSGLLMQSFTVDGTYFTSHVNHKLPGIELSTGSLGHALGVACGSALACKRRKQSHTVFAIVSDGELDEGSNWEAILFAAHHQLDNLVLVVDYNKIQSFGSVAEVMALEPLSAKLSAFNWVAEDIDGHDLIALEETLLAARQHRGGRPKCIIAHTTKGKGVSFMEGRLEWHYRSPSNAEIAAVRRELAGK